MDHRRQIQLRLLIAFLMSALTADAFAETTDTWRYTLDVPPSNWTKPDYDDGDWKPGDGGFGTRGTPNARVGTVWQSDDIWLRKSFDIKSIPKKPALLLHHDEDVEVFINGKQVKELKGWSTEYKVVPIDDEHHSALRTGKNVMAVHCRQTTGGQFIDVHFADAENPPAIPDAKPFRSELITKWGAEVNAENTWTEYPRPQLKRAKWENLNGHWDYAVTSVEVTEMPTQWDGKILVPFCLESKLGGAQRLLDASQALWYRRTFELHSSERCANDLEFRSGRLSVRSVR